MLLGGARSDSYRSSQIEMLNIFVGFEQTNKYAIGVLPLFFATRSMGQ